LCLAARIRRPRAFWNPRVSDSRGAGVESGTVKWRNQPSLLELVVRLLQFVDGARLSSDHVRYSPDDLMEPGPIPYVGTTAHRGIGSRGAVATQVPSCEQGIAARH